MKSRTEYSLMNMLTGVVGYGLNTIIGLVCRIIFVRILTEEYLGISGLFSNILSMLSLAELGISSAITYALYKPIADNNTKKIASIMKVYKIAYMIIGIIVAGVGIVILPFLNVIIAEPPKITENLYVIYLLYLFSTVISYFFSYKSSLLTAMQRNYIVIGYNYIITILQSVIQIVLLLLTHQYLPYLVVQVLGGVGYNLWISRKADKDYPYIKEKDIEPLSKSETLDIFKNVKALAVYKISGVLVNSTDNIAITFFSGLSTVGFASNYTLFSTILNTLVTQIFNALTGSVGNLIASSDEKKSYEFFKALSLANFWLYGWAALGMAFVSSDLVCLLYGDHYTMSLHIPIILALNFYSIGMIHASYTYKSAMGLFRYGQYILIFTGVLNLLFDVLIGRVYGTFGIYVATLLARLLTNLWYEPYVVYKYGLKKSPIYYFTRHFIYDAVLFGTGVICFMLCQLCQFDNVTNIIIKTIICSVAPNIIFVTCFHKLPEYQYLWNSGKHVLTKMKGRFFKC